MAQQATAVSTPVRKFTKDVAPLAARAVPMVRGGKVARVTFFPAEGWRETPAEAPVKGNLVLELLGADIGGLSADLVFSRQIELPAGSVPVIPGAENLDWEARPVDDPKYAKCLFEVDADGRTQFAAGRIAFLGDDTERGLVIALRMAGKTLELGDVYVTHQLDQDSKLPVFSAVTNKTTGEVTERPVLWAHPRAAKVVSTDAEFGVAPRARSLAVGGTRSNAAEAAARRSASTVSE